VIVRSGQAACALSNANAHSAAQPIAANIRRMKIRGCVLNGMSFLPIGSCLHFVDYGSHFHRRHASRPALSRARAAAHAAARRCADSPSRENAMVRRPAPQRARRLDLQRQKILTFEIVPSW
jgi:hypothetical protein